MKGSRILLLVAILFTIVPAIAVKLSLWFKYKNKEWIFYSAKTKLDVSTVNFIDLNGVKTFRYQYQPDSAYLEFNNLYDQTYFKKINNGKLSIRVIDTPDQKFAYPLPVPDVFSIFNNSNHFYTSKINVFNSGMDDIVFHGPVCPSIKATNTTFYIDSVAPNSSFDFDLDFSTFYWENYYKGPGEEFDKKITFPWYMNELKLKLHQSHYYLTKDLYFNKVNIKAIKQTNLDFDEDYYKDATIEVDPSVIVRAPVSIWNKLKLTMNENKE